MNTGILGDSKRKYEKVLDPDIDYVKQNVHHVSTISGLVVLILIIFFGFISHYSLMSLPNALHKADSEIYPESFIAERAWKNLKILNDLGPKILGSYTNEYLAVDFLKRELNDIQKSAHVNQKIINDIQNVSGAYPIIFKPYSLINVYRHVQNVVVKLVGEDERNGKNTNSLMLNCHYDTVPESPGASDDNGNCCIMLEILKVLSSQSYVNRHSIIFLFNGAEETPLQASHGFITQHEWAKDVKIFINLESAGSGGKDMLFQSGPNHPFLVNIFSKVAPHPVGHSVGEEIFQLGLIPSDTDFRIFRDFGHIAGLDFAYALNGYRYHTKYDHIRFISMDSIQRTGDNILALTKALVNSDELSNPENYSKGEVIYFDFLGLFFITYSKGFGLLLNIITVILVTTVPFLSLSRSTRGVQSKHLKREIRIGSISTVVSLASSLGVCYFIATAQGVFDKTMTWYANPIVTIGLYCCPALFTQCLIHVIVNKFFENRSGPLSLALKIQVQQLGTNLFWGSFIIGLTYYGLRSAYLATILLILNFLSNFMILILGIQNSVKKWLYIQMISHGLTVLWGSYLYHVLLGVFIPITGRSGALKNPDILISIMCAGVTFFSTSYISQLVLLLKDKKKFFTIFLAVFLFTQFCIVSTSIGFPYRDDSETEPKPQRHVITHTKRTFFDVNGKVRYTDAGFWFREMDFNAKKTIESLSTPNSPIPQLENSMCDKEVFCGLPISSVRHLLTGGYWLPVPPPHIESKATFVLNSRTKLSDSTTRLNFTLTGKFFISIAIRTKPNIKLSNWNLLETVPKPNEFNGTQAYLISITHGIDSTPIEIILDFQVIDEKIGGIGKELVDIVVTTTHWEYYTLHTPIFAKLLARIPKWAIVQPAVAALNAYTF